MAINTRKGNKQAVLVDMAGGFTNLTFSFASDTEVYNSCSLLFNDKMFVFGGLDEKRQISQVKNCGLKRIASLDFDFDRGTCALTQSSTIILCFAWSNYEGQVCRIADSPTASFTKLQESNYYHYMTKIASNGGKSKLIFIL